MRKTLMILSGIGTCILCLMFLRLEAQSPKAKYGTFALTNATVETVTKGTLFHATVVIRQGKIEALGVNIPIPADAETVDCQGLFVYPGMIDGGTTLGLSEIASDPRTQDYNEVGDMVPQLHALSAINPNSTLIPVTRTSGVTTVLSIPDGSLFSGTAALVNLHGYTPDQMYAGFQCVVLNYPAVVRNGYGDNRSLEEIKKDVESSLKKLDDIWKRAVEYHKLDSATRGKGLDYYPEMQALMPVIRGEMALMVDVNAAKDILAALAWVKDRKIKKVIFSGVAEGWRVGDELAKANVPVITGPVLSLPAHDFDRYDRSYSNAGLMKKAGVKVAIRTMESENVRNLPYHAGFAAAYGLGREEALQAVTIIPAEIFGLKEQLGSIEVGKQANLLVCNGDPFETKTQVKYVFISGWQIPMVNRQTELYEEFLKRDPGIKKQ